jgi:hypothetical protein
MFHGLAGADHAWPPAAQAATAAAVADWERKRRREIEHDGGEGFMDSPVGAVGSSCGQSFQFHFFGGWSWFAEKNLARRKREI